jgi:uncharacterized protein
MHMLKQQFVPHPWLSQPHLMTVASHFLPRKHPLPEAFGEVRLFQIQPEVVVLAHCNWQRERQLAPTIVIAHGLEGSTGSHYMIGTAIKAVAAGFNVVRINQRGCGRTHHLSLRPYHAGLSDDLRTIIRELIEVDRLTDIYLLGFSLGGNQALKLAGEYSDNAPREVRAVCAVSVPIDLNLVSDAIHRPVNRLFEWNFLRVLHRSLRRFNRHYPDHYNVRHQWRGVTIRRFDNLFTAPCNGFANAGDYYEQASSGPFLPQIQLPTLIIQAQDDPFIPFKMFARAKLSRTTALLAPEAGGHLAFLSAKEEEEDRYWVENRALEFFKLMHAAR